MFPFLIGLAALVLVGLITDRQSHTEQFDELRGGHRLGA